MDDTQYISNDSGQKASHIIVHPVRVDRFLEIGVPAGIGGLLTYTTGLLVAPAFLSSASNLFAAFPLPISISFPKSHSFNLIGNWGLISTTSAIITFMKLVRLTTPFNNFDITTLPPINTTEVDSAKARIFTNIPTTILDAAATECVDYFLKGILLIPDNGVDMASLRRSSEISHTFSFKEPIDSEDMEISRDWVEVVSSGIKEGSHMVKKGDYNVNEDVDVDVASYHVLIWDKDMSHEQQAMEGSKSRSPLLLALSLFGTQLFRLSLSFSPVAPVLRASTLPLTIMERLMQLDAPWSVLLARTKRAGYRLAEILLRESVDVDVPVDGTQSNGNAVSVEEEGFSIVIRRHPVRLVGYGMGARVVYYCLQRLAREPGSVGRDIVRHVVLLGAPVCVRRDRWEVMRSVVSGRLVNGYSGNDWYLALLCRVKQFQLGVAGIQPVCTTMNNMDINMNHNDSKQTDTSSNHCHCPSTSTYSHCYHDLSITDQCDDERRHHGVENVDLSGEICLHSDYSKKLVQILTSLHI